MLCAAVLPRLSPPRKRGAVSYGDVTSANIVGYQLIPVQEGFSILTPTFKGIAKDFDLTDIQICDENGNILEDVYSQIFIQKLDETGNYLGSFSFDHDSYPTYGWVDDDNGTEVMPGDYTFKIGEAVSINNTCYGSTVYFKVSGEVDLINKNEINEGFVIWGNSTPVTVDLTDIRMVDESGNVLDDVYSQIFIQKLDETGNYLNSFSFDHDSYPTYGWVDDDNGTEVMPGDYTLLPGEAVSVNNTVYGAKVWFTLPCPVK